MVGNVHAKHDQRSEMFAKLCSQYVQFHAPKTEEKLYLNYFFKRCILHGNVFY